MAAARPGPTEALCQPETTPNSESRDTVVMSRSLHGVRASCSESKSEPQANRDWRQKYQCQSL